MRNTTINELGDVLPIGKVAPDGTRLRDFAFKPWRTPEEKEIGEHRVNNPGLTQGQFVAYVLAYFLTRWQGVDFTNMPIEQRLLALSTSYVADVLYAWIALRRQALQDELDLPLICDCRKKIPYSVSLGTVDVAVPDDDEEVTTAFKLRDGLEWQGKTNHVLTIGPIRWYVYEGFTESAANQGILKEKTLAGSIIGLDKVEGEVRLPEEAIDLTKYDLEALSAFVDRWQPGPDLRIELACPRCKKTIVRGVSWMYDDFFSLTDSSGGEPRERSDKRSSTSATISPDSGTTSPE